MKQHLGLGSWQCRNERAVTRSVPMTCAALFNVDALEPSASYSICPDIMGCNAVESGKESCFNRRRFVSTEKPVYYTEYFKHLAEGSGKCTKIEQLQELFRIAA